MPIIFAKPVAAKGSDECCTANVILLGLPSDGTYEDGLLPFDGYTFVADAVDEINEVLSDIVPDPPDVLDGTNLIGNRTFYVGILPTGLNSVWYQNGKVAGDTVNYIIIDNSIVMTSANPSTRFDKGDEGFLIAKHDEGGLGLTTTGTLDIEANFDRSVVGPATQDLLTWDNQGLGDSVEDALVTFSGGAGSLEVTHVGWHNSFNYWQRMNARINAEDLQEGFHGYVMTHSTAIGDQSTNEYVFWYDDDPNGLSFSLPPSVSENTVNSSKYISGVRYYSTGDTFDITYSGSNVYRKCYHVSHVSQYRFDGESVITTVNPATIPYYTNDIGVSRTVVIDRVGYYSTDARLTAYLFHPWKSSINAISPSLNMLVATCGGDSNAKQEYFCEETYRLPNGVYDTIPPSIIGNWNSQTTLLNGESLVYNLRVQSANSGHNFTASLPAGNPDYSSFSGDQVYLRSFYDALSHNNVILTITGVATSDLGYLGYGNVNLEIKLPTQTGWLDAGKPYSAATFTGIDGDGCQVSMTNGSISLTFGTFSTASSAGMIIIKLTFRNITAYCSYMAVSW
jgi:hypothetical protein